MRHAKCYIKDYPRPQFVRKEWKNLNGEWDFKFDNNNRGEDEKFFLGFDREHGIVVPFTYETKASGINIQDPVENIWYQKKVNFSSGELSKRVILNFEGVDYICKVWVNGRFVGSHKGGYTRFSFDITLSLKEGENLICVKAEDSFDTYQVRGKQRWQKYNYGCWYEQTTGIWKTVWLEFRDKTHIESVKMTPNTNDYTMKFEFDIRDLEYPVTVLTDITFGGKAVKKFSFEARDGHNTYLLDMCSANRDFQIEMWHPENPALYDVEFSVISGNETVDRVGSYFAMREFIAKGGRTCLNSFPFYQKLVLDQGYWEDTAMTPPGEDALIEDILAIKELGYNGVRKHQKVEDERFLYYADICGLLVWVEMPSPHTFNDNLKADFSIEWLEIMRQNYNHPSVVTWVVFNESWGIRGILTNDSQQKFTEAMYYLSKSVDPMRSVISNDGWEHTLSDVVTIHNYEQNCERLHKIYEDRDAVLSDSNNSLPQKAVFANGYRYAGQPIIFSEYGGCAFADDTKDGWGYGDAVADNEAFYERFGGLLDALGRLPYCAGYCYTQLTDVCQEKNGLLTPDRKFKVDKERIKKMNSKIF